MHFLHSELKNHEWTKKIPKEYVKSILRLEYIENMILYPVFGRDKLLLLLNCKIMPNALATSPNGYSECGYTKSTRDTCRKH